MVLLACHISFFLAMVYSKILLGLAFSFMVFASIEANCGGSTCGGAAPFCCCLVVTTKRCWCTNSAGMRACIKNPNYMTNQQDNVKSFLEFIKKRSTAILEDMEENEVRSYDRPKKIHHGTMLKSALEISDDSYSVDSLEYDENSKCDDGQHYCPGDQTCCRTSSGQYGCCNFAQAACCGDYCCMHGYKCDPVTKCAPSKHMKKRFFY